MQSILDADCPGCFNVNTDQESAGYWRLNTMGGMLPFVLVEYAGFAPSNVVGMFAGDPIRVPIFPGSASAGYYATVAWSTPTSGGINLFNPSHILVSSTAFAGIPYYGFGFYIETQENNIFYSMDVLNPDGAAQVLAYREPVSNTWWLAFEDRLFNNPGGPSEPDYNDFVMKVESIVPVPEPAAILLLGAVVLIAVRRLRNKLAA